MQSLIKQGVVPNFTAKAAAAKLGYWLQIQFIVGVIMEVITKITVEIAVKITIKFLIV